MNNLTIDIIIVVVLVLLSAFFSCTETAFSKANQIRLKNQLDNGIKKAKHALWIVDNFDKTLTAILIGNNIVNLGCSSLVTTICIPIFGSTGPAIATGIVTLIILTFGEIIPKCFGMEMSDKVVLHTSLFLRIFTYILYPLVCLFIGIKTVFLKLFKVEDNSPSVTEDELKVIVESIEEEGILEEQESEMVQSALEFDEKTVGEIITPRVDVTFIDINDSNKEIKDIIFKERYSRIPVYDDEIDNIIGILHTRDYLEKLIEIDNIEKIDVKELLVKPHFVYKNTKLSVALDDFKKNKQHISIVTDEYGGVLGIVTMEDLVEEVVGDIYDEDEEVEFTFTKLRDGRYLVSGDMDLDDLLDMFDIKEDEDTESNSVGGFVTEKLGTIPERNEQITYEGLTFTVKKVKNNRILSLIVSKK